VFPARRQNVAFAVIAAVFVLSGAATASANVIRMPTLAQAIKQQQSSPQKLTPPAPPCPQYPSVSCTPVPETPALTIPFPGNMAYYGGAVQTDPHIYIVYWGWGETGAWPAGTNCSSTTFTEGSTSTTLACDPDGAGKRMADFVSQMGGTDWAGVQTQYYDTDSSGAKHNITNPTNQLAGTWVDDSNQNTLPSTSMNNPGGNSNTLTVLGQEAQRAIAHFGITDLTNSNIVIVQPPGLSDPNALSQGYCAFHDYTQPGIESNAYNSVTPGIVYSNIPYQLAINSGGTNVCGENAVNSGDAGKLDGYSIVLGHEIEEAVTDPGAEDVVGPSGSPQHLGGWYDTVDGNENGDKCAWVGEPLIGGLPGTGNVEPIPGAMGDITGNQGTQFAVQSLWSNQAAAGTGYCAGAGTDLPTG
jgi:hypothetical protein